MQEDFDLGYTTNAAVINDETNQVQGIIDFMLLFRKRDPIAVTIILKHGLQVGKWEVSRDLMVKGVLYGLPAGEGDFSIKAHVAKDQYGVVHVLGEEHEGIQFVFRTMDDATGEEYTTHVVVRKHIVKQFMEKTIEMMPRSLELEAYDIDDLITKLLEE